MPERRIGEVRLTQAQQDSLGAWLEGVGREGSISLGHPEWLGKDYVQIKLYDAEGRVLDRATFHFNGQMASIGRGAAL